MATDFLLPDLGEGLTDAEIVRWLVKEGDEVGLNQIICEVETAKALVELPSPIVGTVAALRAAEGDTVMVGAPIITFGGGQPEPELDGRSIIASAAESTAETDTEPEEDGRANMLVGYGPGANDHRSGLRRSGMNRRRATVSAPAGGESLSPTAPTSTAPTSTSTAPTPTARQDVTQQATDRVLAKPPVRELARRLGIDLRTVTGTGSDGAVVRSDVEAAGATAAIGATAQAPSPRPSVVDETRVPISGLRKRTAAAMVSSAFTAPHVTEFVTVDVTATVDLVEHLRSHPAFAGAKVTPLVLVAKAAASAMARHPSLNSHWDESAQEIVTYRAVNLGIAVATPRGLLVPNIRDVNSLTLRGLADEIAGLAARARDGKTALNELSGGTISITNIGSFGIDSGTPIINPGEAAILCTGAIRRQPWEFRDEVALRSVMTLSLSFDHRLVDGAEGSAFLADIAGILRDPLELIALG